MDVQQILTNLAPFVIFGVVWVAGKLLPLIPGWLMVTVVTILSAGLTYISQLASNPELPWYAQLGYGMAAIVISQFIIQFSPKKVKSDHQDIKDAKNLK